MLNNNEKIIIYDEKNIVEFEGITEGILRFRNANFENDYLLNINNTKKYYLVLFVDGSNVSETNSGTFSGKIRFEDSNGKGVTSTFN